MVEGQPVGHCVRCCWIEIHIGREIGLDEAQIWELYYTLLLKDLGCSSNAARICQLYMSDDISFKRDFMTVNGSLPQVLRFVLSHTGMNAGLAERFRALVHIFQNGGQIAQELMETRCDRGAEIARKMRFSEALRKAFSSLDEHWDGGGMPGGLERRRHPDLFAHRAIGPDRRRLSDRQRYRGRPSAKSRIGPALGSIPMAAAFAKVADAAGILAYASRGGTAAGDLCA